LDEIKVENREGVSGGVVPAVRGERWPEPQDYAMEFLKEPDEHLNITLLIAGLLSVVISAFIIYITPQLQSDHNEESTALFRVLLFKIDDTIFGGDVPQVPHWTGPLCTTVMTQALLYLSLVATLASAFLAILAKQLFGTRAFADSRGSNIEGGQNPQRELRRSSLSLHLVLLALSLLLQFAVLLFSCAVSVYIWSVNPIIAAIIPLIAFCGILLHSPFGALASANLGYARA